LNPVQFKKIKSLLEESIALDPRNAEAHFQLGVILSDQEQNQSAVREFERCLALAPSTNIARYRLAQTWLRLGEKDRGRKEMEQWKAFKSREDQEEIKREKEVIEFLYSKSQ
jgi:tetratricopeptide (TPR) repeat protein